MIARTQFFQSLLLVVAAATLVNCGPALPCPAGGSKARLKRAATTSCGTGGGGTCDSTSKPSQVMLSVDSKGMVLEYAINDTTGALTLMCNTATAALGPLAVSNNAFLYVLDTSVSPAQVFGFTIAHGKSGALTAITGSPFMLSEPIAGNASIVADPLGRFMFVTNNSGNDVHVLLIGQSGGLTEATNSPFPVSAPDFIAVNPAGTLAYVPDQIDGDIFIFSLDANGQLAQTIASPVIIANPHDAPHFDLVHPNGKFLLTANLQSISSFAIDQTPANGGALTQVAGSPFSPALGGDSQVAPLAIVLDKSGNFLYVVPDGAAGGITGFLSDNIIAFAFDTVGGGLT
ncbi:MAG TPA: beta-propeller fold lactonase family protein, partial [Candidatus Sulfotelmatobacter sp.]|nr:beta-propeller fold lactonase family protein [Candidatus Sulfotelmatobacter sp.]